MHAATAGCTFADMTRHSLPIVLALAAALALPPSAPAKKSSLQSCPDVNTKIGGKNYRIATKVQVKGVTCAQAKAFFISFGTGNAIDPPDPTLDALRRSCKKDKKQPAAAKKLKRDAYTCSSGGGKQVAKAWMMRG